MACEPLELLEESKCFSCLTDSRELAIQTYLLQQVAGNSQTVGELFSAASCFACLTDHQLRAIQAYLLCQITDAL